MRQTIALLAIAVLLPVWLMAQNPLLVRVKNDQGSPLIGASVAVKGSLISGQTDTRGEIHLRNLKNGEAVLEVSFLGYQTVEKAVSLPGNSAIEIELLPANFLTDEVIVQATRASTNAATTFKNLTRED